MKPVYFRSSHGFEVEVTIVDANPLRCCWRNKLARRCLAVLCNGLDSGVPARFEVTDLLASYTSAVGVLEVSQICSDVENISVGRVSSGCVLNQRAALRIDRRDRHREGFYLTKADLTRCCDGLL